MKVLVYGGTGSQGSAVAWKLLERNHDTYVLTRHAEKAEQLKQAGAHVVIGDLENPASLRAATLGMDAVSLMIPFFLADPSQSLNYAKRAIDIAKESGVKLLVYNTSGPVIEERSANPSFNLRQDIIHHLAASGVPYIVLKPTLYLENLLGPWTSQGIVQDGVLAYPLGEADRVGWLASADLGALTAAAIEHPELAPAQFIVSGVKNLTMPEVAANFTEALGRPITFKALTPQEFGAAIEAVFGPGSGEGAIQAYEFQKQHSDKIPMWTDMQAVLEKLPVQMTSVTDWARGFAPVFNSQAQPNQS